MLPKLQDILQHVHRETATRIILIPCMCISLSFVLMAASPPDKYADDKIAAFAQETPEMELIELSFDVVEYDSYDPADYCYHPLDQKSLNQLVMQIAIETEGCSIEAKRLVAQCILDRTETKICSDGTVYGTLTRRGQFDYRSNYVIYPEDYEAIDYVFFKGKRVTSERIIYFCSPRYLKASIRRWFYSYNQVAEKDGLVFFSEDKN